MGKANAISTAPKTLASTCCPNARWRSTGPRTAEGLARSRVGVGSVVDILPSSDLSKIAHRQGHDNSFRPWKLGWQNMKNRFASFRDDSELAHGGKL